MRVKKSTVSDRNAQILDSLVTGIVVLDENLHIEQINAAAEDLLHTSASHAVGLPLSDLIVRADKIMGLLAQALSDGQPFTEREAILRLPDNLSISVDFTVTFLELPGSRRSMVLELQTSIR